MSRVYETLLVLSLLCALVFGLSWLLLDQDTSLGVCYSVKKIITRFLLLPQIISELVVPLSTIALLSDVITGRGLNGGVHSARCISSLHCSWSFNHLSQGLTLTLYPLPNSNFF